MTKRRLPTDEERALFEEHLGDAKKLKPRAVHKAAPVVPKPIAAPPPKKVPYTYALDPAPAMGGHREAHARRGKLEPQAKLDLHGMTQQQAYRALLTFLDGAQARDNSVILVITGKTGVLRQEVPRWLNQPEMRAIVSGASEAHVRHGGAGALYVSIRKRHGR